MARISSWFWASAAGVGLSAGVAALVLTQDGPETSPPAALAQLPDAAPNDAAQDAPEPVAASAETAPEPAPAPAPPPSAEPVFELVRLEADGSGLIAGRAFAPGAVEILLEDLVLASAAPDDAGRFVSFVTVPPSDQARRLRLRQEGEIAAASVLVAPVAPEPVVAATEPAEAAPEETVEASPPEAPQPAPSAEPEPEAAPAEPAEPAAGSIPAAPSEAPAPMLVADGEGVRVLEAGPALLSELELQTISYSATGDLNLGGRGPGALVRVYLDNRPVGDIPLRPDGIWDAALPEIAEGVYTLRLDAIDEGGAVVSRVETPFRRQDPQEVAALMADQTSQEGFDLAVRTVQKGHSLWAIAEEAYGDGVRYVELYRANRDLIRNPDLIYPGQIFRIPELPGN